MSEFIAIEGMVISHSSGSAVSLGSFTVTSLPSIKSKCSNGVTTKGIYSGTLSFSFLGGTHTAGAGAVGTGTINVTATKTKADGSLVILKGDTGSMKGTYVPTSGNPPTVPFESDVEISDAGQTKVKGT